MDFFASGLSVRLNREDKLTTRSGKCLSILVILLTVIYAIYAFTAMGKRDKVTANASTGVATSYKDPILGTNSKNQIPLELALIVGQVSWDFTTCTSGGDTGSSSFGNMDLSQTTWSSVSVSCSTDLASTLAQQGIDLKNVVCMKIDPSSKSTVFPEFKPADGRTCTDFPKAYYSADINKFCHRRAAVNPDNYEQPFNWPLICNEAKTNGINYYSTSFTYSLFSTVVKTDQSFVGTDFKTENVYSLEYVKFGDVVSNGVTLEITYYTPVFQQTSRVYQKVTDVFASINGIYGLVMLAILVIGGKMIEFERRIFIYKYVADKRAAKDVAPPIITIWDLVKANICCIKSAKKKVVVVQELLTKYVDDNLELAALINFENTAQLNTDLSEKRNINTLNKV